jgi:hypothetical protein
MPMTICVVVVGKQIPMIAPMAYLFSGDARSRHRQQPDSGNTEPTLFDPPQEDEDEAPLPKVTAPQQ